MIQRIKIQIIYFHSLLSHYFLMCFVAHKIYPYLFLLFFINYFLHFLYFIMIHIYHYFIFYNNYLQNFIYFNHYIYLSFGIICLTNLPYYASLQKVMGIEISFYQDFILYLIHPSNQNYFFPYLL